MTPRVVRRLTLALATAYAVLGTLELVLKLADDSAFGTIAFFGGTLLGGAALILCGVYATVPTAARRVLVVLGAATGMLASVWTLVLPILTIAVIVGQLREVVQDQDESPQPEG